MWQRLKINAVFEGGGVKGIALVGALKAAEEFGVTVHETAGTSSGAIVAALYSAGYKATELKEIIRETPFAELLPDRGAFRWVEHSLRLVFRKGLYSGDRLEAWVRALLADKGVRTFGDLPPNKLRIIASDITGGRLLVLPDDLKRYGLDGKSYPVSRAVRMSASIPFFFEPVILRTSDDKPVYIVDGGLLSNFPLWLFDRAYSTRIPAIGFQLVGKQDGQPREIHGPLSLFHALFATMLEAHDERYIEEKYRFRTVKIPTLGVRTTQFNLSESDSVRLYESGYHAGRKFFGKWSLASYHKLYVQYNGFG